MEDNESENINIEVLYPGEPAVIQSRVDKYKKILKEGKTLEPIKIANLNSKMFVTNGNNRVRATIEYFKEFKPNDEIRIDYIERPSSEIKQDYMNELELFSKYYGQGVNAFLKLETSVNDKDYYQVQARIIQNIRKYIEQSNS